MKSVRLLAVAALFLGASAVTATAASAGPLTGAEQVCVSQGGTWHPNGFPTFPQPSCDGLNLTVLQDPGSSARNQLTAADNLCKAAGFAAARTFGKGIVVEGQPAFLVVQWSCVGTS